MYDIVVDFKHLVFSILPGTTISMLKGVEPPLVNQE